jgi:pathogenesis-related protein 1
VPDRFVCRRIVATCCAVGLILLTLHEAGRGQEAEKPPVNLTFTNATGGPVEMFWLSLQGERSNGVIKSGQSSTVNTEAGRMWVIRDLNKNELIRTTVSAPGAFSVTIGTPAAIKAAVGTGTVSTGSTTGSALTPQEAADLLALHNKTRQEVGVPPLRWSPVLAAFAQAWADELAQRGTLDHRPREGPSAQKYGENLAVFGANMTGEHQGAGLWTDEKAKYTPGTPFDPNAGAGHYTQMVWRGTTELGAGKAPIQTGPFKGMWILVGNYNPAGNHGAVRPDGTVVWERPY